MKAIVWRDTVDVEEVQKPEVGPDELLVKVGYGGICGSDITIISGKHLRARPPLVLGHEFMGVVAALPDEGDTSLTVGQRVTVEPLLPCGQCRPCLAGFDHVCQNLRLLGIEAPGGFAEYAKVPKDRAYALPETISDQEAALVEPVAVAVHAVDLAQVKADDFVVVLGAGPIGLLTAQVVRAAGASKVWVSEMDQYRLDLASELGFDTIDVKQEDPIQRVFDLTGDYGTDVTFEAAGVPATARQMILLTGVKGRIVMVAIHKKPCEVEFQQLAYREQTILGSRVYAKGNFPTAINLIAEKKVQLEPLMTKVFDLADGKQAIEMVKQGTNCCKVLLKV